MTELVLQFIDTPIGLAQHQTTMAQKALQDSKALPENALLHGAYYSGFLDNMPIVARWNAKKHRFVMWEHNAGAPKLKAALHVGDPGIAAHFAAVFPLKSVAGNHVSDFALETTR